MEINYGPSPETAYVSLILDEDGEPEDIWAESIPEVPDKYPMGWNHKDVAKYKIEEKYLVAVLQQKQTPNNWKDSIEDILRTRYTTTQYSQRRRDMEETRKKNYIPPAPPLQPPPPPQPPPSQTIKQRGMDNRPAWMTQQPPSPPLPPPIQLKEGEIVPTPSPPYNPNEDSILQPLKLNQPDDNKDEDGDKKEETSGKKTVSIMD